MPKLFVSNKDESARLFKSDVLEFFTHVHWSVPIILYGPVVVYLLVLASREPAIGAGRGVALFAAGVLVWTLSEYLLHRFVFHFQPSSGIGKRLHFLMHGVHHDYPSDSKRLVMPPSVSIPLALIFYGFFLWLIGGTYLPPFFAGFLFGYICYDSIHYATHHAPMKSGVAQALKHHHIKHHFQDPDRAYGVSSPLWDYVFRTTIPEEKKDVPVGT